MGFLYVKSVRNVLDLTTVESNDADVLSYLVGCFKTNTQPGRHGQPSFLISRWDFPPSPPEPPCGNELGVCWLTSLRREPGQDGGLLRSPGASLSQPSP